MEKCEMTFGLIKPILIFDRLPPGRVVGNYVDEWVETIGKQSPEVMSG